MEAKCRQRGEGVLRHARFGPISPFCCGGVYLRDPSPMPTGEGVCRSLPPILSQIPSGPAEIEQSPIIPADPPPRPAAHTWLRVEPISERLGDSLMAKTVGMYLVRTDVMLDPIHPAGNIGPTPDYVTNQHPICDKSAPYFAIGCGPEIC